MEKIKKCLNNLLDNFAFVVSCTAFTFVSTNAYTLIDDRYIYSKVLVMIIATITALIVAMLKPNLFEYIKKANKKVLIISGIATIGLSKFYVGMLYSKIPFFMENGLIKIAPEGFNKILFCGLIVLLLIPFCMVLFTRIYEFLRIVFIHIFKNITKKEIIVLVVAILLLSVLIMVCFARSDLFYNAIDYGYDKIYGSDTTILLGCNAWLNVFHNENDIRQPLFAVFSMPFVAPIHAVTGWFGLPGSIVASLAIIIANTLLIVVTAYMLSTFVEKGSKRIIFLIFYLTAFSTLLFNIMIEQYGVAVFWLVLFFYMYINNLKDREISYIGATLTLLTSGIAFWLIPSANDDIKTKISKIFKTAVVTFLLLFLFGRLDLFLTFKIRLETMMDLFTTGGDAVSFIDKLEQFTHFITNCFVSINGGAGYGIWVQRSAQTINWFGVGILVMSIISFFTDRKNNVNKISIAWIAFAFFVIVIVGWGTRLDETLLYAHYFGWAFMILVYKLLKKIFEDIKKEKYFGIIIITISIAILLYNLYNIDIMVRYLEYVTEVSKWL